MNLKWDLSKWQNKIQTTGNEKKLKIFEHLNIIFFHFHNFNKKLINIERFSIRKTFHLLCLIKWFLLLNIYIDFISFIYDILQMVFNIHSTSFIDFFKAIVRYGHSKALESFQMDFCWQVLHSRKNAITCCWNDNLPDLHLQTFWNHIATFSNINDCHGKEMLHHKGKWSWMNCKYDFLSA